MGLLDLKSLLSQYAPGASPSGDAGAHFQQVAESVDSGTLAHGIAAAMRSDETPPFPQLVSQLFSSASNDQKLAMLKALMSSASPEQRAHLEAAIPGLASPAGAGAPPISPAAVQTLAGNVEKQDAGIVDKMSGFYAEHPTLVRTLGAAAMMIAMRKIAERRNA